MTETIQRASVLKRIAAYLLDLILLSVLVVGVASLLSLVMNYDGTMDELNGYYDKYAEKFGISFEISNEAYNTLSDEERDVYEQAFQAMNEDEGAVNSYNKVVNATMIIATTSILVGYLLLEFLVPMLFKNGQTVGKKIFSLALSRDNCVKVSALQLFVRTVLGKCTVGTLIPVMVLMTVFFGTPSLVGLLLIFGIAVAQLLMFGFSTNHSTIHDRMAGTVVIDLPSQMIFQSEEHLLEYKKERHKAEVEEQPYF